MTARPIFIAGVAETPLGKVPDHTELSMVALAAQEALAEAGMTLRDVDGLFAHAMGDIGTVQVGEYLGIRPRFADSTDLGGSSFEVFIHHAMLAIRAGECEVALVVYASRQRSKRNRPHAYPGEPDSLMRQLDHPYGLPIPIGHYALIAARHMYEFGTTSEQLAEVAVAARRWAQLNPKAWVRDPLSVDDVLASRMIADPIHKLDCCLQTDGGGALVITTAERARNAVKKAVRVIGAATSHVALNLTQTPDLTTSPGASSGPAAFKMAGITPADVDVLEPYDSFTITPLIAIEDLGFCKKGEGGSFVEDGRLGPGGSLPSMTSGGGLSYNHPGAFGLLLLVEAVRQLRGECGERQVKNAKIAVAHGVGGWMSAASTVVLASD